VREALARDEPPTEARTPRHRVHEGAVETGDQRGAPPHAGHAQALGGKGRADPAPERIGLNRSIAIWYRLPPTQRGRTLSALRKRSRGWASQSQRLIARP